MRILHILHSLDQAYGGPVQAVLDLSSRAAVLGLEAEVLGLGPISIPDNPFPLHEIHSMRIAFPEIYGYAPDLKAWLHQNLSRFDGVILHGMWMYPNLATFEECRRQNVPYVCFPHGMFEPWALYGQGLLKMAKKTLYWNLIEQRIFSGASALFFTTERERALALQMYVPKGASFIVIPYAISSSSLSAIGPGRTELAVAADRKVALFLGRVNPKKNVDLLIEAWGRSKPAPEWLLVIAGPAETRYRLLLESIVRRHSIGNQVHFTGFVSGQDKSYLLGRASWFLLPSKQENFGISVLEAVNAGCPVAISDQVFLSDYFHKSSEILPVKLSSWIDFIHHRMPDEQHRKTLIELDRKYVVPQFSMDNIVKNWVTAITEVFTKKDPAPEVAVRQDQPEQFLTKKAG